jgi:hypothetical protein
MDDIKMDIENIWRENADKIHDAHDENQWRAVVSTVINLHVL